MKNKYFLIGVITVMLLLASPSFVIISSAIVDAQRGADRTTSLSEQVEIRQDIKKDQPNDTEIRSSIRADTEATTRDRQAIICGQIIPGDPRKPGEAVDCVSPSQPVPTFPPGGGPGGNGGGGQGGPPAEGGGEMKREDQKTESNVTSQVKGLSKTASFDQIGGQILRLIGLLWLLLTINTIVRSKKLES